jgi:hypothetical protein
VGKRSPAYCFIDKKNRLRKCGGTLDVYGLGDLIVGDFVEGRFPFLDEISVGHHEQEVLPYIPVTPSVYADVHVIGSKTGLWVVFLDSTGEVKRYQLMQQRVNETNLLRERLSQLTGQLEEARKTIARLRDQLIAGGKKPNGG